MYNQGIGCKLARFYQAWASELEEIGNTKKADQIFSMGHQAGAQPIEMLNKYHAWVILYIHMFNILFMPVHI